MFALIHQAGFFPRDHRFHDHVHVFDIEAVAGDRRAIQCDLQLRLSRHLLYLHILGPCNAPDDAGGLIGQLPEGLEVIAKDLDGDVRAHARDQLGHAHFDRLRKAERSLRRAARERLGHLLDELLASQGAGPLGPRLQRDKHIGSIHAHGIRRHLGAPNLAHHVRHFREPPKHTLGGGIDPNRLIQRHAGQQPRLDGQGPLIEPGYELGTEERKYACAPDNQRNRPGEHEEAVARHRP